MSNYLDSGEEIKLKTKEGYDFVFRINNIKNIGGSTVCYEAERIYSKEKGFLKEFFPVKYRDTSQIVRRGETNTLYIEGGLDSFLKEKKSFLSGYEKISSARNNSNSLINNFVPHTEVFDDNNGSAYIWTPEPVDAVNFKDYIIYISKNPVDRCEQKLLNIIRIINTLSKCAEYMHESGFICLDFKPENLSIEKEIKAENINDLNTSKISYYDLDSIREIGEKEIDLVGTLGYCSPEVKCGFADKRSDIYSIGAILYNAIVVLEDGDGHYYNDLFTDRKKYSHIQMNVSDSLLINNSIINSNEEIKNRLITILKKCLHFNPNKRYQKCSELIYDLEKVIAILTPNEIISKLGFNKYMVINDINSSLRNINIEAILQLHLWNRPLYSHLDNRESITYKVLIIGNDDISLKYVDMILLCQMYHVILDITILTENAEKLSSLYCKFRPASKRLININGNNPDIETRISFKNLNLLNIRNNSFIKDVAISLADSVEKKFNRVFISLGEQILNESIACQLNNSDMVIGDIDYISFEKDLIQKNDRIFPIVVNEEIQSLSDDPGFKDLERMAFNTHVIWKGLTLVSENDYYDFRRDMYNYNASLRFALSVKYKLYSLGINMTKEISEDELKSVLKSLDREELYKIADIEHRRWNYSYLIDGWDAPSDIDGFVDYKRCIKDTLKVGKDVISYSAKNADYKLHACMVPGSASDILESYSEDDWLYPSKKDNELDQLDRVSIELYRTAVKEVKNKADISPEVQVKKVNYKLYDVILLENIYDIVFCRHIDGVFDYVPEKIVDLRDHDNGITEIQKEKIAKVLKEYFNRIFYDKGWRYGEELSYDRKKTPNMVSYEKMNMDDKIEYMDIVNHIVDIINNEKDL